jgi:hypothetical protein
VAENAGLDTQVIDLFDPTTHELVETLYAGNGLFGCQWSATGFARDLGSCFIDSPPLRGIGWNLTIACSNDPQPGDAGVDAAVEASVDAGAD